MNSTQKCATPSRAHDGVKHGLNSLTAVMSHPYAAQDAPVLPESDVLTLRSMKKEAMNCVVRIPRTGLVEKKDNADCAAFDRQFPAELIDRIRVEWQASGAPH